MDDGPVYDKKGSLEFACYTNSDYAGCKDTRRSVSCNHLTANSQLLMWGSALQGVSTHSSTKAEYINADVGARNLTYMSNLADELKIPMRRQPARLIIDDKPSTKCHDGVIVENKK
eukprot:Plantae.Rhodophyta-Palmaria_palmata.ctg14486.p1 GENE.Plantae.Rhodophyta-Palmaria_palmata.ctg14486~~Plantae.Rhodophyta-Palmaria_palmata.ctg14486.p1  ORF type:complete len:116 (-),score=1.23 Plantae.Rhodophyta-Palmaria_palmata.ctg14486:606-953(-)